MKLSNGKTSSVSRQRLKMYIAGHGHVLLPARSIFCHNYMRRQLASLKAERPAINKNDIFLVSELQVILSSHCLDICRFGDFPQVQLESRSCCSQGKHSIMTYQCKNGGSALATVLTAVGDPLHSEQQINET